MKVRVLYMTTFISILSNGLLLSDASGYKLPCPDGMENIHHSDLSACYALVDPAKGPMSFEEAKSECRSIHPAAYPVVMSSKKHLADIINWAIWKGLPTSSKAGFWLGFQRLLEAPMNEDGTLSVFSQQARLNRNLYRYWWPHNYKMAEELWRDEKQPNDSSDERCTAQKKPGDPKFLGIDSYPCEGFQLHFAVCIYFWD